MEEILIRYAPVWSVILATITFYFIRKWEAYQKRNAEEAKEKAHELAEKRAIEDAVAVLREHADQALNEKFNQMENTVNTLKPVLASLETTVSTIDKRVVVLETTFDWVRKCIEQSIAIKLKSPTHPEKDILLKHMADDDLTLEEAETLRNLLDHEKDDPENKSLEWWYCAGIKALDLKIRQFRGIINHVCKIGAM